MNANIRKPRPLAVPVNKASAMAAIKETRLRAMAAGIAAAGLAPAAKGFNRADMAKAFRLAASIRKKSIV